MSGSRTWQANASFISTARFPPRLTSSLGMAADMFQQFSLEDHDKFLIEEDPVIDEVSFSDVVLAVR